MTIRTNKELSPIPFSEALLAAAQRLKQLGVPWSPHTGCFVWDSEAVITSPSPFPLRIYFILNMRRFLDIFGTVEKMQQQLVWIPTWYQAVELCRILGGKTNGADPASSRERSGPAEDQLLALYRRIGSRLEAESQKRDKAKPATAGSGVDNWILNVIQEELGSIADLPGDVRRRITSVYREVGRVYLGWRRIQDQRSDAWYPPETRFDPALMTDLGHFYSDYQPLIRSVAAVRANVARLRSTDPSRDRDAYQAVINQLLRSSDEDSSAGQILADLVHPT